MQFLTSSDPIKAEMKYHNAEQQMQETVAQGDTAHEYICFLVQSAGEEGVTAVELRDMLTDELRPERSIKLARLSWYLSFFPASFSVIEMSERKVILRVRWSDTGADACRGAVTRP
jgi:hypothetical protein